MKTAFEEILKICEKAEKHDVLSEIARKAKNEVIRNKFANEYGVVLDSSARLAEYDYHNKGDYERISWFEDGYKCHEESRGRSISWSEDGKQPVNEWIYSIGFSTGAYIFGEDYYYQQSLFRQFFEELRTYKPDYEDLHNNYLYWKIENASTIYKQFYNILEKYKTLNREELGERKIAKLKAELEALTKENNK